MKADVVLRILMESSRKQYKTKIQTKRKLHRAIEGQNIGCNNSMTEEKVSKLQ